LVVTLRITRQHHGNPDDPWTNRTNVDYLRVYVPEGSELLSASGWTAIGNERFQEPSSQASLDDRIRELENSTYNAQMNTWVGTQFGKTVFSNWIEVPVGGQREIELSYRLPFQLTEKTSRYSLLVQAQPGAANRQLSSQVSFPESRQPTWMEPSGSALYRLGQTVQFSSGLEQDRSYGVLFERQ
jgi:uncharacterized protein YidB (DUF937 family)